ncbi:Hypothetical predicted protein [Olea europaea subsp. europaea]|uniref:Uncharacterized protein n=1 Tax=Olea europaea subsp. europaea TaxID=158383 RepID=A0A8S0UDP2_OLEEU|nr:Hypothetical predicted protein [Olea europaea subsp. europaea]
MPDLDLVEALSDDDVVGIGALYFLTAYLFPKDYKKVVDNYLFALVEDFDSRKKKKTKNSTDNASTSGKSMILLMDSSMGQPNISNDDDDFVDPPPRRQESPP